MSNNEIERLVYSRLCANCPSKELCGELGQSCREYEQDMQSALNQMGETNEKN